MDGVGTVAKIYLYVMEITYLLKMMFTNSI